MAHETRLIMGMPIEVAVVGETDAARAALESAFAYLTETDERFSTYKAGSEISRMNRGELALRNASAEVREIFERAEDARKRTNGYFDIRRPDGTLDPSGIVKGWAVRKAAERIRSAGFEDFFVNAGGDIASGGQNHQGGAWSVGIENPLNRAQIVKVVFPRGKGVATSGSYIRGAHIYDPHEPSRTLETVKSITVIGPDVEAADVLATAAFAMGEKGIEYIERTLDFEGYQVDAKGIATMTSGFAAYTR
jgi:thiamine biosynthesis lipoprotein